MKYTLTLPGKPVAKGRPKFTQHGHAYTPGKTRGAEAALREAFAWQYPKHIALAGPVRLTVIFYMPIPEGMKKADRIAAKAEQMWHTKKPDTDNMVKLVTDALNGLAFWDDSQVCDVRAKKLYSGQPRTVIEIESLEE